MKHQILNCVCVLSVLVSSGNASAQQGVPAPAGQPSAAPTPTNSQPRPTALPAGTQPEQPPATPAPSQTEVPSAGNPAGVPAIAPPARRSERPFAFQSPTSEGRFLENSRRLMSMETRLNESNQALLKRLGELRNQPVERQTAGLADILQAVLLNQAEMHKYLVQARSAWSGEMEEPATKGSGIENVNPADGNNFTTPPGTNPQNTSPAKVAPSEQPRTPPR